MAEYRSYTGLDVHKDTIAVVLPNRKEPVHRGEVSNRRSSLRWLVRHPISYGEVSGPIDERGGS